MNAFNALSSLKQSKILSQKLYLPNSNYYLIFICNKNLHVLVIRQKYLFNSASD